MTTFSESVVEDATIASPNGLDYAVLHGPYVAIGEPARERSDPNRCDAPAEKLK